MHIDTAALLAEVVPAVDALKVPPSRITIAKGTVRVDGDDAFQAIAISGAKTVADLSGRYPLPNLVDLLVNLMEHTTPSV